jgi:hypothetical protein
MQREGFVVLPDSEKINLLLNHLPTAKLLKRRDWYFVILSHAQAAEKKPTPAMMTL